MTPSLVIDSDGHVTESVASLQKYLRPEHRGRTLWSRDAWDRSFGGTLGKDNEDPKVQLADMDAEGIDVQVVFTTRGLRLNMCREVALAVDVARAYNDWLADFCSTNPQRLKGIALVALQDVDAAIKEARRAVQELGHVGVMAPTNVLDQDIGDRRFWPFYEEIERLGVGLAIHAGINSSERMHGRFGNFIAVHTVAFPLECMVALVGLIFAGVPEMFPKLRVGAMESCCGWLPFLMDRMDEEFEIRGHREAPMLKAKPSEYLSSGRFYFSFEIEESMLPTVISRVGADKLLYASDYPHWDSSWPNTVKKFRGREDIPVADKTQILSQNPQNFYGFRVNGSAK
jgi:predicted TIM-barrel fold metal-dependent hydrolase